MRRFGIILRTAKIVREHVTMGLGVRPLISYLLGASLFASGVVGRLGGLFGCTGGSGWCWFVSFDRESNLGSCGQVQSSLAFDRTWNSKED